MKKSMKIYTSKNCNLFKKFQKALGMSNEEFKDFYNIGDPLGIGDWHDFSYVSKDGYFTMTKESISQLVKNCKAKGWSNETMLFNLPAIYLLNDDDLEEVINNEN